MFKGQANPKADRFEIKLNASIRARGSIQNHFRLHSAAFGNHRCRQLTGAMCERERDRHSERERARHPPAHRAQSRHLFLSSARLCRSDSVFQCHERGHQIISFYCEIYIINFIHMVVYTCANVFMWLQDGFWCVLSVIDRCPGPKYGRRRIGDGCHHKPWNMPVGVKCEQLLGKCGIVSYPRRWF